MPGCGWIARIDVILGVSLYLQAAVRDAPANAAGFVLSQGIEALFGAR